jgi:hypothetical protein
MSVPELARLLESRWKMATPSSEGERELGHQWGQPRDMGMNISQEDLTIKPI